MGVQHGVKLENSVVTDSAEAVSSTSELDTGSLSRKQKKALRKRKRKQRIQELIKTQQLGREKAISHLNKEKRRKVNRARRAAAKARQEPDGTGSLQKQSQLLLQQARAITAFQDSYQRRPDPEYILHRMSFPQEFLPKYE